MSSTPSIPDINLHTAFAAEQAAHAQTKAQLVKAGADLAAAVAREQKHQQDLTDHKVAVADAHKLRDEYQAHVVWLRDEYQAHVAWLRDQYKQATGKDAPTYTQPSAKD